MMRFNEEQLKKCQIIFEHYGFPNQVDKLKEELDELMAAEPLTNSWLEEFGDVYIMMIQIYSALANFYEKADEETQDIIKDFINLKLDRTFERIKKGKF